METLIHQKLKFWVINETQVSMWLNCIRQNRTQNVFTLIKHYTDAGVSVYLHTEKESEHSLRIKDKNTYSWLQLATTKHLLKTTLSICLSCPIFSRFLWLTLLIVQVCIVQVSQKFNMRPPQKKATFPCRLRPQLLSTPCISGWGLWVHLLSSSKWGVSCRCGPDIAQEYN